MSTITLVRPVLVTAVDGAAAGAVARFARHAGAEIGALRAVGLAPAGELPAVDARGLEREVLRLLERSASGPQLGDRNVHWLVAATLETSGTLDGEIAPVTAETQQQLLEWVLPLAGRMQQQGLPFRLTLLLADLSLQVESAFKPFYAALAADIARYTIYTETQVYVLRQRLADGRYMRREELDDALALACQALALTNVVPSDGPPDATLATLQAARPADVVDGGASRVFGRIAVQALRSLERERANGCALDRLRGFAREQTSPTNKLPVGWAAPEITLTRPDASAAPLTIGADIRGGPTARFSGRPHLFAEPVDELRRLETDANRWVGGLEDWRRAQRASFAAALRELRERSAVERNRVRETVDAQAATLWTDPQAAHPVPRIAEWIRRQREFWRHDQAKLSAPPEGLRIANEANARQMIEQPFTRLRGEMARRPNTQLMVALSLGVAVGGALLLWDMLSEAVALADDASWLGRETADQLATFRVAIILAVLLLIAAIAGVSLFRTRLRWDAAYSALVRSTGAVARQEAATLQRELQLVDSHWHVKTFAASLRHLERVERRLQTLVHQLRRASGARLELALAPSGVLGYLPAGLDPAQANHLLPCDTVSAAAASQLLRSERLTGRWLRDDAATWRAAALNELRAAYRAGWHGTTLDDGGAARGVIRDALAGWPADARQYLPDGQHTPFERQLLFGTGTLGALARTCGEAEVVQYRSDLDEVLFCTVQMGLDPATAAR